MKHHIDKLPQFEPDNLTTWLQNDSKYKLTPFDTLKSMSLNTPSISVDKSDEPTHKLGTLESIQSSLNKTFAEKLIKKIDRCEI